tara:strand:+ start:1145 stop:2530 length:1386 start_codon:yes stop_codon:yes gene_type:complete
MNFNSDDLFELEEYFKNNNIPKEKVCLVGSSTLSLLGIRNHNDIDIIIHSSLNISLTSHLFIEQVKSPWSKLHSDDEIIENSNFHIIFNGFKFVLPEFVYHRKVWHNRVKDMLDIRDLEDYAKGHKDWNWSLIKGNLPEKSIFQKTRERVKILNDNFLEYFRKDKYLHDDINQMVPTNFLLSKQIINDNFNRFDVLVRYLAIQSLINKEGLGINLYKKMQNKRKGSSFKNPWRNFKNLIYSFKNYGYDYDSNILVNNDLHIIDGSHRLACALYFNIPFVAIKINRRLSYAKYGLDWFKDNDFSSDEITLLTKKRKSLFLKYDLHFIIVLWPPAYMYFDDIELEISKKFYILESTTYCHFKNFDEFVKNLYKIDDIKDWKVAMKIKGFANYEKNVRILKILINNPNFRRKANRKYISKEVEELKAKIREKYSNKIVNYFHDILIHASDNYKHTRLFKKLIDI